MAVGCEKSKENDGVQVPEEWEIFSVQDLITDESMKMYSNTSNRTVIYWGFYEKDWNFWSSYLKITADASLTPLKFLGGGTDENGDELELEFATNDRYAGGGKYWCSGNPYTWLWDLNPRSFDCASNVTIRLPKTEGTFDFALICETQSGKTFRSPVYRITVREYTKEELGTENTSGIAEVKIEKVEQ